MKSLPSPLRQIIAVLIILPLLITVIFGLLLLALCLQLYRLAHQVVAFLVRPDLEGMLPPVENVFAHDNLDQPCCNICVVLTFEGKLSLECMQSAVHKNMILASNSDGKLKYPELQKYWSSFGSYKFWKSDLKFDVKKHVRKLDYEFYDSNGSIENLSKCNPCTEEDLKKIFTRLQVHPWRENQSPWEMLLIPNYQSEEISSITSFIFRLHHTLGDGYTIQKLLLSLDQAIVEDLGRRNVDKNRAKMSLWQQCKFAIATVYQLPIEILDFAYQFSLDKHDWMGHSVDSACSYFTTWTKGIDIDIVKKIKREHSVSFNAVTISAVISTFERMVQDARLDFPKVITAFFPVPMPNPPNALRIHSSSCVAKFSLGSGNSVERLVEVDKTLKGIGRLLPRSFFIGFKLYGMFPSTVLRRTKVFGCTIGLTCIPGPQDACYIQGHKLERVLSNFPVGPADTERGGGCTVTAFSSFGKMRIVITLTTATWPFPPEILHKNFDGYIHEEIEKLRGFPEIVEA